MTTTDKEKAIDLAIGQIEKQFGKGSIMRLGNEAAVAADIPGIMLFLTGVSCHEN